MSLQDLSKVWLRQGDERARSLLEARVTLGNYEDASLGSPHDLSLDWHSGNTAAEDQKLHEPRGKASMQSDAAL